MISLCITGQSPSAIAAANAALEAAGMAPARGLEREAHINFSTWHERVYQALEQRQSDPADVADEAEQALAPAAAIGRLWAQLANDLFLANIDTKVWGWAEARSLGLLDFWLELDPGIHFVLLATSPAQYLAERFAQLATAPDADLQAPSVDGLVDEWQQAHQAMLHFALHHPKRCVLLLSGLAFADAALVQAVKAAWPRKLSALRNTPSDAVATSAHPVTDPATALLQHFAEQLCHSYPQALSLHHEVASVALALQPTTVQADAGPTPLQSLLTTVGRSYRVVDLQRQAVDAAQLTTRLKDAEEEGELVIAQLHQVQEELERYYLRNTELEAQLAQQEEIDAVVHARNLLAIARNEEAQAKDEALAQLETLGQQCQALLAERDAEAQAKADALVEVDTLVHARNLVAAERLEERAQLDALEQQNQTLAEALEAQAQAQAEVLMELDGLVHARNLLALERLEERAQMEALEQQNQTLVAELEAQAQIQAAGIEELDTLARQMEALNIQLDEERQAKQEALDAMDAVVHQRNLMSIAQEEERAQAATAKEEYVYLLGQLQQVQEELERCYLRSKDLETIATQTARRFSRVVLREPDGIDWESVYTTVVPGPGGAQLRCQATQVAVAGKAWDALEFTAHLHQGALAFTFSRSPEAPGPLTRWPRAAASASQWTATVDPAASSALKEISTSDWDLLRGLPKLLTQGLKQAQGPWPQGAPVVQDWLEAARATLPALQRQPLSVRIDTLRLQANRVLAGREYLVLRAEQLTLAQKRFAALEFRLGCNLGPKGEFGQTARLEFFKGGTPPLFDNWAPNVQDPAGDRLDLVFVFPGSMNLKDWAALSANDRSLVLLLADQLPGLLADLQTGAQRLSRPLNDWIALANTLRSFVRERLDVTGLQKTGPQTRAKSLPAQPIAAAEPARKRPVRATPPAAPARTAPAAPKRAIRAPTAPAPAPTAAKGRKK